MNHCEYDRMFRNEDEYWWFVSRRELVLDLIGGLPRRDRPLILDVGCGTGATAAALGRFGRVVGVDFSPLALACCRRRNVTDTIRARAESLPLQDECVDAIVATDILEHLDDDAGALAEFYRVLKPGGHAVITVPAYQFLWSEHDEALMHRRRYLAGELIRRCGDAGFRVTRRSYALCFLFPLALGRLLRPRATTGRQPEAQLKPVSPWLNSALIRFQRLETSLLRKLRLPFGLTAVAVIQKPAERGQLGGRSPAAGEPTQAPRPRRRLQLASRSG